MYFRMSHNEGRCSTFSFPKRWNLNYSVLVEAAIGCIEFYELLFLHFWLFITQEKCSHIFWVFFSDLPLPISSTLLKLQHFLPALVILTQDFPFSNYFDYIWWNRRHNSWNCFCWRKIPMKNVVKCFNFQIIDVTIWNNFIESQRFS